ncbi:MAG TPA: DDE-type integrase/transposase/recombinase [Candidatus Dormibacteraeota bacterium]|nr:DDE-type integrase/transposase/recombinase [Candidatus Dormibacteraeota bacterium]
MRLTTRYELAAELRGRYYAARGRKERSQILDQFCAVTSYNRKHAITVLRGRQLKPARRRRRARVYDGKVEEALKVLWETSDYICAERLQPFLPDLLQLLERHGDLHVNDQVREKLGRISPATIKRLIRRFRGELLGRRLSTTKPGTLLRREVPVLISAWEEDRVGFLEMDLVAHCGDSTAGEYINTLSVIDLASGWSERVAIMGKSQKAVLAALRQIREQLPFELRGLHSDNGSEFLNGPLLDYCRAQRIAFSRSRPYHKNDNAHVEQKNWSLVRKLIGYRRLDTRAQLDWLNALYEELLRPYNNCFQPVMKLIAKERQPDGRIRKRYDVPQTPLQRVLASGVTLADRIRPLVELYTAVSPLNLKRQIDRRLAAMPAHLEVEISA